MYSHEYTHHVHHHNNAPSSIFTTMTCTLRQWYQTIGYYWACLVLLKMTNEIMLGENAEALKDESEISFFKCFSFQMLKNLKFIFVRPASILFEASSAKPTIIGYNLHWVLVVSTPAIQKPLCWDKGLSCGSYHRVTKFPHITNELTPCLCGSIFTHSSNGL